MAFIPLKVKLTIYTLFFIITSMLMMGVVSDNYLHGYFHESAKKELKEGFFDLAVQMKIIEKDLLESLYYTSESETIIASLNLIKNYEDVYNYNKIIFDEEKKRIVETLTREAKYSLNDHIAVYDHQYRLVAFVDKETESLYQGYVSYENGEAVYYIKYNNEKEYQVADIPVHIDDKLASSARIGAFELQSGGVIYEWAEGKLSLRADRPLVRKFTDSKSEIVGYIENSAVVSRIEMDALVEKEELFIDYYFSGEGVQSGKFMIRPEEFDNAPLLFSQYQAEELALGDSEFIFYSGVKMPLERGSLLITAQINKHELYNALKESRIMLATTLVIIVFLTILISLIILNKMITLPLTQLLEGIGIISRGEYKHAISVDSNDELGMISSEFNEMARKVEKREKELDELAHHDVLTKLPNRVMFQEQLEIALSREKRVKSKLAVLFLDLDEFKTINDTLGHDVGDALLVKVAHNLTKAMRRDDLLARIGGDEFNLMIENFHSPVVVEELARKLVDVMRTPLYVGEEQINITGSIGITIYPDDGEDSVTLLKNADLAMYYAKASGRNRYHFFSEELESTLKKRTEMLKELKNALINEELVLYYQPKFSLKEGRILGAEALIRWESPKLGFVVPNQFIPLAEESGEIIEIGEWILNQACADFGKWKKLGLQISQVSVNVSNIQFAQESFVEVLQNAVEEAGIEAHELELEMTESYIHDNSEKALEVLHKIRSFGVDLAIDDFGTGYSSMSYLKRLPLSRLKIDKSFIDDTPHNVDDTEITKVIIALAKVLELSITAEGIETLEQMRFLQKLECDEGQGYLCSKPLPYLEFVALLQNGINCMAVDHE